MGNRRIAVIGAGIGGLAAALELCCAGFEVTVFERAATPGGKLREVEIDGRRLDAGPTVFTLREIFDDMFAAAGLSFEAHVTLKRAEVLARHAWGPGQRLDLFADAERSVAAIGEFAGSREARGFVDFAAHARRIYETLEHTFIRAPRPSPLELVRRVSLGRIADLWNIQPFDRLWRAAGRYFRDPRLQQLFGRYATYCGSSPFLSPATLMLVAHVEQAGVWYVEGGMHRLAVAVAAAAARRGAVLRYGTEVRRIHLERGRVSGLELADTERVSVDAVVSNADTNALAAGAFGRQVTHGARRTATTSRSLSAVTWNLLARTSGFELAHHSVFFGGDYRREFDDIFRQRRLPSAPTIYVCAQDRRDGQAPARIDGAAAERLLCLINAPAIGDSHRFEAAELQACETRVFESLRGFGLDVERRGDSVATSPADFDRLFPATGGALYGRASHGWRASFERQGSRSRVPGLYLAGGSAHPGPGVPMAATSGRLAAACIIQDLASTAR